ncbi:hypothetical protein FD724_10385 [Nostoc sp. C057]|uniref:hypothetical protein n=1 Tax=Nostoc sp. C057 TaxID=2576903 RepID=UPI0015C2F714|nr:hypothetical protein [Nostoc sp. C057]QLE48477.1 hypothetical protein FD724_10385 [Nostoc sp. C057]
MRKNKVPVNRVSTALNSRWLRVERSRNPSSWDTINPQIPYWFICVYLRSPNNSLKECQGLQCDGVPAHRIPLANSPNS